MVPVFKIYRLDQNWKGRIPNIQRNFSKMFGKSIKFRNPALIPYIRKVKLANYPAIIRAQKTEHFHMIIYANLIVVGKFRKFE